MIDRVDVVSQPADARLCAGWTQIFDVCEVIGIHAKNEVETFEIFFPKLARAQVLHRKPRRCRRRLHRAVRRFADVPTRSPGAVDLPLRTLGT